MCTVCESHIDSKSKHCRECNRCVASFDHHCQWLNNCIGKFNYRLFFYLVGTFLLYSLLILGLTIYLTVKNSQQTSSLLFSSGSSLILVYILLGQSALRALSLSQLFIFHVYLGVIKMSTYEFIVESRELKELADQLKNEVIDKKEY